MTENEISRIIFDCALNVHKSLGPGLLESAYEACLFYEDVKLKVGYRLDLLVENKVIIEIKSVETLNDIHMAQVLTYLKLSDCKLGMLINFNVVLIKNGIKRVENNL